MRDLYPIEEDLLANGFKCKEINPLSSYYSPTQYEKDNRIIQICLATNITEKRIVDGELIVIKKLILGDL
jgi:hypothetical protein